MKSIDAKSLKIVTESGEEFIVDVRTPMELLRGKIKGSINIPLDVFQEKIEAEIPDKNSKVYLYCLSGSRSNVAAGIMESLDYKNVYSLENGLLAWRSNNYPLV